MNKAEFIAKYSGGYYGDQSSLESKLAALSGLVYDALVRPVTVVAAAVTLTMEDSGKIFSLNAAAGAQITLPAVASSAGFKAKFVVGLAFATTAWTIKAATNKIQGGAVVNSTFVPGADENTITFAYGAETIGDYINLECDGVNWYADGVAAGVGGITFTAP